MAADALTIVTGVCHHDCPDSCVWEVTVDADAPGGPRAVKLRGKESHPFTRGELCPKVNPFLDRVYHPDRVLHPMIRTGPKGDGEFTRVSWDDALAEIAGRLEHVIDTEGPAAILPYGYAGNQGLLQCAAMSERLFNRMGASRIAGGLCGNTANAGIVATIGSGVGIDPEDLRHAKVILLWSTNTLITNRHLWPFITEARSNGATVVCIDPLRTRTAASVDWHVQPLPGTDAALALGMMHVLIERGLVDDDFVRDHTTGFDELAERVAAWTPQRTGEVCGLAAADIVRLATLYGSDRPAAIRVQIGMEHREHGAMAYRNIACLPALTGAWRDLGGGMVRSTGPLFEEVLSGHAIYRPDLRSHPRRGVQMGRLGEALAEPFGPDHVAALVVYNCNPAAITPNQATVLAGLGRDDLFTVVIEQFITDSARYADVVLPATTQIEHLDLMAPWGHLYLTLNLPAVPPLGEALPNTEIFRRLAAAMGYDDPALQTSDEQMIRDVLDAATHPYMDGITYDRLAAVGSIRLGVPDDWRPYAGGDFPTASGTTEFFSSSLAAKGLDPLPAWTPATESLQGDAELLQRFPLACITIKRHQRFLNSSYSMLPAHTGAEGAPVAEIHPADAAERAIVDGDRVRVWNDRGSIDVIAQVTDRVRPSVVTVSFGWSLLASAGVGCNTLTNAASTDMGGGTAFHDNLVEVARVSEPTPL